MDEQSTVAAQNMDVLVINCLRFKRKLGEGAIKRGIRHDADDLEMLLLMHEMLLHMVVWLLDDELDLDTEVTGRRQRPTATDEFPF